MQTVVYGYMHSTIRNCLSRCLVIIYPVMTVAGGTELIANTAFLKVKMYGVGS